MEWTWQRLLTVLLALLTFAALGAVLWVTAVHLSHTIIAFLVGLSLAYLLNPVAYLLQRVVGSRWLAVTIVFLSLAGMLVFGGIFLAVPLADQVRTLANDLPGHIDTIRAHAPEWQRRLQDIGIDVEWADMQRRVLDVLQESGDQFLTNLIGLLTGVGNAVVVTILGIIVSIYLMLDGERMWARTLELLPRRHRHVAERTVRTMRRVVGGYIRGQLLLALVIGFLAWAGMYLLGVRYALVIGLVAGIFELVPFVGPVIGGIVAVIIAWLQGPFSLAIYTMIYFLIINQLEGAWLAPKVRSYTIGMHPLAALLALVAGFEVGGLAGGIVAIPVVALVAGLVSEFVIQPMQARRGEAEADAGAEAGEPAGAAYEDPALPVEKSGR